MRTKTLVSMFAALVLAAAFPACGEDEPATGGPAQTTDGTVTEPSSSDLEQAIEDCRQSVEEQPQLSAEAKSDLEALCDEAKSPEEVKETTREVCERMVEENVPEGAARDQALETCRTATE